MQIKKYVNHAILRNLQPLQHKIKIIIINVAIVVVIPMAIVPYMSHNFEISFKVIFPHPSVFSPQS